MPPESSLIPQTRRPPYLLGSLPREGGSRAIAGCSSAGIRNRGCLPVGRAPRQGPRWHASARRRNEMHPEDLMKPDLFSEIVLLGSGTLIFVSLLLIVGAALTRA